jgi:Big-like domain-containing protein
MKERFAVLKCRQLAALTGTLTLAAAFAPTPFAKGVEPQFELTDPARAPFPSDRFTTPDASQLTGVHVKLPKPDCAVRPSDCNDLDILNTLDGFNLQPRLSIPFTGSIDLTTVSSASIFLFKLGPQQRFVGINQVVWDPETTTLYAESDELLDQHTRYLLVVTDGVRDTAGNPIESAPFRKVLNYGQTSDPAEKAYRAALLSGLDVLEAAGLPTGRVAAASVFTTESATAVMEKIRDQIHAATPAPADFMLGTNGERTFFSLADVASITWRRQETTAPTFTTLSVPLASLRLVPGAIGTIAFGKYRSPEYESADGVIASLATLTGTPEVQRINDVYFNLFLPAGPAPAGGWPIVIAGHGAGGGGKNTGNVPVAIAATLAEHGLATIAINAVGIGGGPLGTLTVTKSDATAVMLPAGGRNVDRNGNGVFDHPAGSLPEGFFTSPNGPEAIVFARDALRQTVVDLMQLVREIQIGIDVTAMAFRTSTRLASITSETRWAGCTGRPSWRSNRPCVQGYSARPPGRLSISHASTSRARSGRLRGSCLPHRERRLWSTFRRGLTTRSTQPIRCTPLMKTCRSATSCR